MKSMFTRAKSFNGDLSKWNVGKVTDVSFMFREALVFNQDLSTWNVGKVTDMQGMFSGASAFNHDLSKWNVGQVTNMGMMFSQATSFEQVLCGEEWVSSKANTRDMFDDSPGSISRCRFQPQNSGDLAAAVGSCPGR